MTWIVLATLVGSLILLAANKLQASLILIFALCILIVFGVLPPELALKGFTNPALLVIGALYVVMSGLKETGALQQISRWILGHPKSERSAMTRLWLPAAIFSSVINNSPVVAMLTASVQAWCRRHGISRSRLLLPLSYMSILGGICTLIGTSTNLVVDSLMREQPGVSGFTMFELAWVGLPLVTVGFIYLFIVAPMILRKRTGSFAQFENTREYLVEVLVEAHSELVGQQIQQAGLRNLPGLFVIELQRGNEIMQSVDPLTVLEAGDRLVFAGAVDSVAELRGYKGLKIADDQTFKLEVDQSERRLFEAVLSASNPVIGKTLKESRFRHRYSSVVLSVSRHGKRLDGRLGDLILQPGDTLLLEASKGFYFKYRNNREFLLVGKLGNGGFARHERAPHALIVLGLFIAAVSTGFLNIVNASILAGAAMLVLGCTKFEEAKKSIDFEVLIVIACAYGLGMAVKEVGLAQSFANSILNLADQNPILCLIAIYVATLLLTEMVTNNAAAVVMFPVALSIAVSLDLNIEPFAVAVMVAASASFLTPIGYQTNLMVMGPGGYRFSDYLKLGLPLSVIVAITSLSIIPLVWPLQN